MKNFAQPAMSGGTDSPEAQAARWLARRQLGLMRPDEQEAFEQWLREPDNAAAWGDACEVVESVCLAASHPGIVAMRAEALARPRPCPLLLGNVPVRLAAGIAAGIVIAVGLAAVTWNRFHQTQQPAAALPLLTQASQEAQVDASPAQPSFETRRGERRTVVLPDGSQIILNTASRAELAFDTDARVVRLTRGQAFFVVARDRKRPFRVVSGNLEVTALGTRFDVRMDPGAALRPSSTTVTLVEGKVQVEPFQRKGLASVFPTLARRELTPGQQATGTESAGLAIAMADLEQSTSWQSGRLTFRERPLAEAIAEVNRYSERQLVLAAPSLADLPVSGVFSTDHPENFIAAVVAFYPVRIEERSPNLTVLQLDQK